MFTDAALGLDVGCDELEGGPTKNSLGKRLSVWTVDRDEGSREPGGEDGSSVYVGGCTSSSCLWTRNVCWFKFFASDMRKCDCTMALKTHKFYRFTRRQTPLRKCDHIGLWGEAMITLSLPSSPEWTFIDVLSVGRSTVPIKAFGSIACGGTGNVGSRSANHDD